MRLDIFIFSLSVLFDQPLDRVADVSIGHSTLVSVVWQCKCENCGAFLKHKFAKLMSRLSVEIITPD